VHPQGASGASPAVGPSIIPAAALEGLEWKPLTPPPAGRTGAYFGPFYYRMPNMFSWSFPMATNMLQTMPLEPARPEARDPGSRCPALPGCLQRM
jgi:hypothetical protein